MFNVKLVTDVVSELLSVADLKEHLRITFSDDDTYLGNLIKASRKAIENYCIISIGSQTRELLYDGCSFDEMELPYGPCIAVTLAEYKIDYGSYGSLVPTDDYDVDGLDYKTFTPFTTNRFRVTYTTGITTLPDDLKNAWMRLASYYYENRGDTSKIPDELKNDLNSYKRLVWL